MSLEDRLAGATGGRKEGIPGREDILETLGQLGELYARIGKLVNRLRAMDLPADEQARAAFQAKLKGIVETAYGMSNELALYQSKAEELLKAGPLASYALFRSLSYAGLASTELRESKIPADKLAAFSVTFEYSAAPFHARYETGGRLTLSTPDPKDEQSLRFVASCIDSHHGGPAFSPPQRLPSRTVMHKTLTRMPPPAACADALDKLYARYFTKASIDETRYMQVTRDEFLAAGIPHEKLAQYTVD